MDEAPRTAHEERLLRHTPICALPSFDSFTTFDSVQDTLRDELGRATFEGESVRTHFCPVENGIGDTVFDALGTGDNCVYENTSEFTLLDWPKEGSVKTDYSPRIVAILNMIIDAYSGTDPVQFNKSVFRAMRFRVNDKRILCAVPSEVDIAPPLLSCQDDISPGVPISWYQTSLVGEFDRKWGPLASQAAIYARCLFAASEDRIFVPVLCLNYTEASFRLCIFHRGGLLATTPMILTTECGFREFVSTIIGLWQWDTPAKAGFEPALSQSYIRLNGCQYRIDHVLSRRPVLCGKATSVYAVRLDTSAGQAHPSESHTHRRYLPEFTKKVLRKLEKAPLPWDCLNPFDDLEPVPPSTSKCLDSITLPETFIVKCSHQPVDRDKEEDIFRVARGYVGVPEIITGYDAENIDVEAQDVVFWDVFRFGFVDDDSDSDYDDDEPTSDSEDGEEQTQVDEEGDKTREDGGQGSGGQVGADEGANQQRPQFRYRIHRHLIIKTMGNRLHQEMGPRAVALALQHAAIGHCALFTMSGYVHGDISQGNIIVLFETEIRQIPSALSSIVRSPECSAVLVDGDAAKKWISGSKSSHRSGTLPFLSWRIARLWEWKEPTDHTPLDDLESFIWVLLYSLLEWTKTQRTRDERMWWGYLNGTDGITTISILKKDTVKAWGLEDTYKSYPLSSYVSPFRELLHDWFVSVEASQAAYSELRANNAPAEEVLALFERAYVDFICISQRHIEELPLQFDTPKKKKIKA
ncbi:hypothetical protein ONZ45_g1274 [Pleurotus djamor]|nr:hypothetical protein ONZ45_g1274 [Pleurotus djamor]